MKQIVSTPWQLGQILQAARKAAGLNQTEAAARLNVSQSRMSHMELNPDTISVDQLLALVGALGLELVVQDRATGAAEVSDVAW
ncbi:Antitoxin HipB [compost metagenome]